MGDGLKESLDQYKFRWKNATDRYIKTYADKKVNGNATQNDRALSTIHSIFNEINMFKANLTGDIANTSAYLNTENKKIDQTIKEFESKKTDLVSAVGDNKASKPFKTDKYDENGESYINVAAYIIAICSTSFFIYKQINQ